MSDIFSRNLNALIKKGEVTKFSRECGISEGTLRGYLRASTSPNVENLLKIAATASVSVAWLVGEEEEKKQPLAIPTLPDKSMQEMAKWINEQNDGINYWEVAKAKLANEFPEFKEWLKKQHK